LDFVQKHNYSNYERNQHQQKDSQKIQVKTTQKYDFLQNTEGKILLIGSKENVFFFYFRMDLKR
jgi:hypothetical protein